MHVLFVVHNTDKASLHKSCCHPPYWFLGFMVFCPFAHTVFPVLVCQKHPLLLVWILPLFQGHTCSLAPVVECTKDYPIGQSTFESESRSHYYTRNMAINWNSSIQTSIHGHPPCGTSWSLPHHHWLYHSQSHCTMDSYSTHWLSVASVLPFGIHYFTFIITYITLHILPCECLSYFSFQNRVKLLKCEIILHFLFAESITEKPPIKEAHSVYLLTKIFLNSRSTDVF